MGLVHKDQLNEGLEPVKNWRAEDLAVSPHRGKKAGEEMSETENFQLVVQCSFLLTIAGIVAGLIAA